MKRRPVPASYAKFADDPRVFTIENSTKSQLDKTAQDLRDKRLLIFEADKLTRVELTAKGQVDRVRSKRAKGVADRKTEAAAGRQRAGRRAGPKAGRCADGHFSCPLRRLPKCLELCVCSTRRTASVTDSARNADH